MQLITPETGSNFLAIELTTIPGQLYELNLVKKEADAADVVTYSAFHLNKENGFSSTVSGSGDTSVEGERFPIHDDLQALDSLTIASGTLGAVHRFVAQENKVWLHFKSDAADTVLAYNLIKID